MPFATYRLGDLPLESGEILRDAQITYAPHGQLAPDRRNVVLCPTFFGGDHTGYDWLIGSGRPLDTDRYRVVVPGLFGNGFSSSRATISAPGSAATSARPADTAGACGRHSKPCGPTRCHCPVRVTSASRPRTRPRRPGSCRAPR